MQERNTHHFSTALVMNPEGYAGETRGGVDVIK